MTYVPGTPCMNPITVCIACVLCCCTGMGLNSVWNSLFYGCGIRFTQNCITLNCCGKPVSTLNCCGKPVSTNAVYCVASHAETHNGTSAVYC
eukprot:1686928-Amphidinium_carterae.1